MATEYDEETIENQKHHHLHCHQWTEERRTEYCPKSDEYRTLIPSTRMFQYNRGLIKRNHKALKHPQQQRQQQEQTR